jgi:hypothetical protein
MNTAELDMESAELLPDRQALGCWKWSPCGREYYSYTSFSLGLSISFSQVSGY